MLSDSQFSDFTQAMCHIENATNLIAEFVQNHGGQDPDLITRAQIGDARRLDAALSEVARQVARAQLVEVNARMGNDFCSVKIPRFPPMSIFQNFESDEALAAFVMQWFGLDAIALKVVRPDQNLTAYSEHFAPTSPLAPWLGERENGQGCD